MKETKLMPKLEVEYPSRVTCNKCANVIWDAATAGKDSHGFPVAWDASWFEVTHSWGYGSPKDGERHDWDLCESCYVELVKSFKVPVSVAEEAPW